MRTEFRARSPQYGDQIQIETAARLRGEFYAPPTDFKQAIYLFGKWMPCDGIQVSDPMATGERPLSFLADKELQDFIINRGCVGPLLPNMRTNPDPKNEFIEIALAINSELMDQSNCEQNIYYMGLIRKRAEECFYHTAGERWKFYFSKIGEWIAFQGELAEGYRGQSTWKISR